jgi:hypothetical protein
MAGMALLQVAWILVVPVFGAIDEYDHVYRAAAVAHGEWRPGPSAADGRGRLVTVPKDIAAAATRQCADLSYTGPDNCVGVASPRPGMVRVASGAADYNPPFYALVGTIARPFHGATAVYAMRIATGLICLLLIGAGAWCLRRIGAGRWTGIGLLIAWSPVGIYSTIVVAPNGPEIAAGFALWSALLALAGPAPPRIEAATITVAGVAAILLGNLRQLGPGFLVITVLLCVLLAPARAGELLRRYRSLIGAFAVLAAISVAEQLWWMHAGSGPATGPVQADPHAPWRWGLLISWPLTTIAAFPFRDQPAPVVVYPLFGIALLALWWAAVRRSRGRLRVGILVLTVGVLVMPVVLTAATYDSSGVIWQGRYGLPLAVGLPLLSAFALGRWRPREFPALAWLLAGVMGVIEAASLLHVRGNELVDRASKGDPSWHVPAVWLVLALVVLGTLAQAVVAGALRRGERAVPHGG